MHLAPKDTHSVIRGGVWRFDDEFCRSVEVFCSLSVTSRHPASVGNIFSETLTDSFIYFAHFSYVVIGAKSARAQVWVPSSRDKSKVRCLLLYNACDF